MRRNKDVLKSLSMTIDSMNDETSFYMFNILKHRAIVYIDKSKKKVHKKIG